MEPNTNIAVGSLGQGRVARAPRGRHRRDATVYARKLTAERLRILLGGAEGGVGSIRQELAHIRSHRAEPFGVERLQVLIEVLGLDLFAILSGQAPDTRLAS